MMADAEMTPALDTPPLNLLTSVSWMPATTLVVLPDVIVFDWISLPVLVLTTPPEKVDTTATRMPTAPVEIVPLLVISPPKLCIPNATMPVPELPDTWIVPLLTML